MSRFVLFHWIVIQIFIVPSASETVVRGVIGQTVRLPCFYQVAQQSDISDMCWGRGPCPNSKCNNKILHTTRNRVTFRKSQRYNLQGYISNGDVSLTIGRVKAEDAGTYCCRIEIPGWFNDIKLNIRLELVRAPPVMTTTTRKAPVSPKHFRKTTFAPQATSAHQTTTETDVHLTTTIPESTTATTDHQTTAETAVLTTTVPPATIATTQSPAVITLETVAPPAFVVTANDAFPEAMVTISALPDFSTGFQAADLGTEDDIVLCPEESIPLPEVTPEFPGTLAALEGAISPYILPVVEDLPTAVTATLQIPKRTPTHVGMERISVSSECNAEKHDDNGDKLPVHASLIASILVVSIAIILMLSLLCWKRKHTKKVIMRSVGPVEDLETVFSGTEGENSIHSL